MRKKHIEVLKDRISHADVGWLARQGWNLLSVHASFKRKKVMNSPIFGGFVITYRCNETCPMCNVYKLRDKVRGMKTDEWLDIVDQFAELKVAGISIAGGEPLVYEGILDVIRRIKSHKIPVSISTNGLLLRRKGLADELLDTGIDSIAISIDGASLILDDALGYTDPERLKLMGAVLTKVGRECQIIILTCVPDRYNNVGEAKVVRLG